MSGKAMSITDDGNYKKVPFNYIKKGTGDHDGGNDNFQEAEESLKRLAMDTAAFKNRKFYNSIINATKVEDEDTEELQNLVRRYSAREPHHEGCQDAS